MRRLILPHKAAHYEETITTGGCAVSTPFFTLRHVCFILVNYGIKTTQAADDLFVSIGCSHHC